MSISSLRRGIATGSAVVLASLVAHAAIAQTAAPPPAARPTVVALDDAQLGQERGGQAIVVGNQTLNSSLTGNTIAGNYTAGAITLSDNAFANFNGMGNVVINSGAQANLQSAMNLTVNLGN
ncbi:hypothetical protein F9288_13395 [Sphingomonas sp. CL5.1]|uniref:hypothetical protein n=1 Tax=Sphingomonas sp. CL5.1 TaxID=2653203 RepID=UPI0015833F2A|nr:hypothetical protein [Sphingomonas sp. CL5.1]QKS00502.1 hypothetical protein F9288_13395 [Sphingomonas sp. CL5.1]